MRLPSRRPWLLLLAIAGVPLLAGWTPSIGEPPSTAAATSGATATGPRNWQSGLTVDVTSRESARTFFRAIYQASEGVPIGFTGNIDGGVAGNTSAAFKDATALRINWYRAMAGVPADISLKDEYSQKAQKAALMMSANGQLSHTPPNSWKHYSPEGAEAAGKSNLGLADNGPDTITSYMLDPGGGNYYVGHRRWLMFPTTRYMGTGDVEKQGSYKSANALWVFDGNTFGPRPSTRDEHVSWPPRGYVPYYTIFSRWSFGHPKANIKSAIVTMSSKGVPIPVKIEPIYDSTGDKTLVWIPAGFATDGWGILPRPAADTQFDVTITNVLVDNVPRTFSYSVIAFDPVMPGPDTVVASVVGPDKAQIGAPTAYAFNAVPKADGYRWQESRVAALTVNEGGEGNSAFSADISPGYDWKSYEAAASGTRSFHLAHPQPRKQSLTLERVIYANAGTTLTFKSMVRLATKSSVPRVQAKIDGSGIWGDVWAHPMPSDPIKENGFSTVQIPLGAFAGKGIHVRFVFDHTGSGTFYPSPNNTGWYFDDVSIAGAEELLSPIEHEVPPGSTAFSLVAPAAGRIALRVRPRYYGKYYLDWGPVRVVEGSATAGPQITPPIPTVPPVPTAPTTPPPTPTTPPPTPPTKPPPPTPPVITIPDLGTPPPFPGNGTVPPIPIGIPGFPWKP